MKLHIAIVDDNSFLIQSIKDKLLLFNNIVISFIANDGIQCMDQLLADKRPNLILMDIEMPGQNGIITSFQVKQKFPHIKIIILTVFDNDEHIFNAIQAGADGYLLKETPPDILYNSIVETLNGGAVMTPSIAMRTLQFLWSPLCLSSENLSDRSQLTKREIDVLEQLSKGLTYTLIADNLCISPSTVRRHTENIYRKLQVHSKVEAITLAKQKRMI